MHIYIILEPKEEMSSRIYMLRSTIEEAKFRFRQTEQSSLDNKKGPSLRLYLGAAEVGCSVIQELLPSEDHGEEDVDSVSNPRVRRDR